MFTSRPGRPAAPGAPVQRTDRTRQVRCEGPGQVRILNKFSIATDTEDWRTVGAWPPGRRLQRALCTLNPHAPVGPVSPQSGLAGRIRRPASRLFSFKWPKMTARRRRGSRQCQRRHSSQWQPWRHLRPAPQPARRALARRARAGKQLRRLNARLCGSARPRRISALHKGWVRAVGRDSRPVLERQTYLTHGRRRRDGTRRDGQSECRRACGRPLRPLVDDNW
jgi:hypothetical protein